MAKKKAATPAKPKAKSNRGGPRPFSGRPTTETNRLRAEIIAEADKEICDALPKLIANMIYLANGGFERIEEKWEPPTEVVILSPKQKRPPKPELVLVERKISIAEPDRGANQYLIDRILGKPKQSVEMEIADVTVSAAIHAMAEASERYEQNYPDGPGEDQGGDQEMRAGSSAVQRDHPWARQE